MERNLEDLSLIKKWRNVYREADVNEVISIYERYSSYASSESPGISRVLYESETIEFRALRCLKEILQKKLFNIQCLWRARKVDLPIRNVWEIYAFRDNLFRCPFIHPITQEEIDEYIRYWLSDEYREFPEIFAQDYERFKDIVKGQEHQEINEHFKVLLFQDAHYPRWYAWYDRHFNTGHLLDLEDYQLPEEQLLTHAYNKKHKIDLSGFIEGFKNLKPGEHLYPYPQLLHEFAVAVKDTRMLPYFKDMEQSQKSQASENVDCDIEYLENIFYRKVPVEASADWREGIAAAARKELQKTTLKFLPDFYQQYLQQNFFIDKYFNPKKWERSQKEIEEWEKVFEEGRQYIKENPGEFDEF